MRFDYDPFNGLAYIYFEPNATVHRTVEMHGQPIVNFDYDADDRLVGIEILL